MYENDFSSPSSKICGLLRFGSKLPDYLLLTATCRLISEKIIQVFSIKGNISAVFDGSEVFFTFNSAK